MTERPTDAYMINRWRLSVCAAFCILAAASASAQTVFVRHAPAGRTIDVVVGRADAGKATADENGDARVPISLQSAVGKTEMDANVFVDVCQDVTRVIVEAGGAVPPAADVGCERRDVQGLYAVKAESTLVVNVAGTVPSMLLIQGAYKPPNPSEERPEGSDEERPHRPPSTGLTLYGAGSFTSIRDTASNACGNVSDCTPDSRGLGFAVGGVVWLTNWLGAEAGYLRPAQARATDTTDPLHIDMKMKSDLVIVAGKLAVPAGPARIYGTLGANYEQATQDTSETLQTRTATASDGSTIAIPGGTQTFHLETQGWSYLFGGGAEVWVSRPFAIFGELNVINLKGKPVGGGEGRLRDRFMSVNVGLRLRVGKSVKPTT
jgi:hypothetical protein